MKKTRKTDTKKEKGQTSVEYMMLLLVVVVLAMGVGKRIKALMLPANGEDCPETPGPNDPLICKLLGSFQGEGVFDLNGRYRYFTLKR